jgi:hypothetical protein
VNAGHLSCYGDKRLVIKPQRPLGATSKLYVQQAGIISATRFIFIRKREVVRLSGAHRPIAPMSATAGLANGKPARDRRTIERLLNLGWKLGALLTYLPG